MILRLRTRYPGRLPECDAMTVVPSPIDPVPEPKSLEPRREPKQARSRERLERILDATGELIEEAGVEGLSTRSIASRAGVNVATIYQFFPNKYAVFAALVERTADRLLRRHEELRQSIQPGTRMPEAIERVLGGFAAAVLEIPGFFAMRRAMGSLPEFAESHAIEERTRQVIGTRITERLRHRYPAMDESQHQLIALTMIQMTLSMLELSTQVPEDQRAAVISELRALMISYLSRYFGADAQALALD